MKHKVESIDYLRAGSILLIILLHIIHLILTNPLNRYSSIPILMSIRNLLNFSIITLVFCSGFSLYISQSKKRYSKLSDFYKKRFKKLIVPWIIYVIGSIIFYIIMVIVNKQFITSVANNFGQDQYLTVLGVPIAWIMYHWIVILMLILALLFPLLKHYYEKYKYSIVYLTVAYLFVSVLSRVYYDPLDLYKFPDMNYLSLVFPIFTFILGWSIVYMFGFYIERLYNNKRLIKKELRITLNSIFLFVLVHIIYKTIGLDTGLHMNKFPPTPYFITFGMALTFILLAIFFSYKQFIHAHLRRILSFFSSNSYWLYLWSYVSIVVVWYVFSFIKGVNIYLLLSLEFVTNCGVLALIVKLQKKLIKIEMHKEKHHF